MTTGSDERLLDEFFQAVNPTIEELVTRAVQQGQRVTGLAVILERKFDGEVAGGCGSRSAIDGRLRGVQGVDDVARQMIVRSGASASQRSTRGSARTWRGVHLGRHPAGHGQSCMAIVRAPQLFGTQRGGNERSP
jgi:hypothetical protein